MRTRTALRALAATLISACIAQAGLAAFYGVDGVYTEDRGVPDTTPDSYELANQLLSTSDIVRIELDLSSSNRGAFFDPGGSPFVVLGGDAVGFDGNFNLSGNQFLTLNFTDFNPGETFLFGVDTDDPRGRFTSGTDFAGSQLDASFQGLSQVLTGFYTPGPGSWSASANVPEPESGLLTAMGLVVIASFRRHQRRRFRQSSSSKQISA